MWYVQAVACLIKAVFEDQNVDVLYLPGCSLPKGSRPDDDPPEVVVPFVDNEDTVRLLPAASSRAADSILLTRVVLMAISDDRPTNTESPCRMCKVKKIKSAKKRCDCV